MRALWLGLLLLACPGARGAEPARLALVIGNAAYAHLAPLPGCAASAALVAAALKRAGFEVTQRTDPSNGQMGAAVTGFGDALASRPGAIAVIYACGYAIGFERRVFLLPASAALDRETDALTQGMLARLLTAAVPVADAGPSLVLLDTAAVPGSAVPPSIEAVAPARPAANQGIVLAFRTSSVPGGSTPLSAAFATALAQPAVELGALVRDVQASAGAELGIEAVAPTVPAWLVGNAPPPTLAPSATPQTMADGPATLDEADRRRVQLALQRLGYFSGRVNGTFGAETGAAIRRFQGSMNAAITGRLTRAQATRLLSDGRP